ncbi:hypothetical protein FRB90_000184 [Tulasnella sp. 427]|nr:hypothetical protein FRB90_000184 [Tulasnella sp. 427]
MLCNLFQDEQYEKLRRFQVDRRRIVPVENNPTRAGGYGIVQKAELHESPYLPAWLAMRRYGPPQIVAVKQIRIPLGGFTPDLKRAFTKEILVWSSLEEHPGVAKFLGFYADLKRSEAWLLSPWEPNGNISEFVAKRKLEIPEKLGLVYDTIGALCFLHQLEPPVCHGDIKSANVLVGADFRARLCDFGLARLHEDSGFARLETSTGFKGSIRWCSPEVLNGAPRSLTSDVYSWAWLVWEIMTGELPYADTNADFSIIRQIFESPRPQVNGEARLSDCLQVWELMTRCWEVNPLERPTTSMCKTAVENLPHCTPSAPTNDGERSPQLLETLGDLENWKGNTSESLSYLSEALTRYEQEGNAKGVASVLEKQAATQYRNANSRATFTAATAALDAYKALGDPRGVTQASFWLAWSLAMQDRESEALPRFRETFDGYQIHKNDVGAARCLVGIGEMQRRMYQEQEALVTLDQAMTIAVRSGDRLGAARALRIIAATHTELGDLDRATEAISDVCSIARNLGWNPGLSNGLGQLANIKTKEGSYDEAEKLYQESISVARRSNDRWEFALWLQGLGDCLQTQSKLAQAEPVLEEAWRLYGDMEQHGSIAQVASSLGRLKCDQGIWNAALQWHDHAIAVYRRINHQTDLGYSLENKAAVLQKAGRYDEAALHLEAAIVIWEKEGYHGFWTSSRLRDLITLPKTAAKWEHPLLCDVKRLQRRLPSLSTACLQFPIDEEYHKLGTFQIDRGRVVFFNNDHTSGGGYGIVLKAELHESAYLPSWLAAHPPQMVAVKQLRMSAAGVTPDLKRAFTKEILVWSSLAGHPGIARFLGFYADFKRSDAWLISPWEPNGNISEFLARHQLEVPEKLGLANVLVGADFKARLCDFGLARLLEDNGFERLETSTGFKGSIRWCSPEVLDGKPRSSTSDVYSWAWLVWEIMTGELPYAGTSAEYSVIRQIFESPRPQINGEARLSDCLQVWELMTRCWGSDPAERPTASMCETTVKYLPHCTPSTNTNDGERSPQLLETLGDLESWKGNTSESLSYLGEALTRYEKQGNAKGVASVLEKPAATLYRDSNFPATFITATAALEAFKKLEDPRGVTQASFWLASSLSMQRRESEALPRFREAFDGYQTQKDDVGAVRCLVGIGEIQRRLRQKQEAFVTLDQATTMAARSGDRLGVARALRIVGSTHLDLGDLTNAATNLSEACTIARKVGWDLGLSHGLGMMANIKVEEGQYQAAEELYREAISVARRSNERWCLANLLHSFGGCLEIQSNVSQATPLLRESWQLYQDMGEKDMALYNASKLATMESDLCKWDAALFWHNRLIAAYRHQKQRANIGLALENKAAILRKAGRYDEAALHLEAAIVIWEEEGYDDFRTSSCLRDLITLPKTAAKWERPLSCDVKRLQRRLPSLSTHCLKLPITPSQRITTTPAVAAVRYDLGIE